MKKLIPLVLVFSILSENISAQLENIIWQTTIGGNFDDSFSIIIPTSDGGFLLGGDSGSEVSGNKTDPTNGGQDYWVVKLDDSGSIEWQNSIGGANSDFLEDIIIDQNGGYVLAGRSASGISGDKTEPNSGFYDYWVVKIDASGNIIWQNTMGGDDIDDLYSIEQTSDNGYILGGWSQSDASGDKSENSMGLRDYWVVKLNNSGIIEWENTIGGNGLDHLNDVLETSDGGYLLVGDSSSNISGDKTENSIGGSDYWIVKINESGNILWQNTIGGSDEEYLWSAETTDDDNYILAGNSRSDISGDKTENSNGGFDYWVVKIDQAGNILWQNTIGGNNTDVMFSIQKDLTGNFTLGGYSSSDISGDKTENSKGLFDFWAVNITPNGDLAYQKTIGGDESDLLYNAQQLNSGEYILGGSSRSDISGDKTENSFGGLDYWIVKMDGILGIDKDKLVINSIVYPVPAGEYITLNVNASNVDLIHVYSSSGGLILTTTDYKNNQPIDISNWSAGIYYLQYTIAGRTSTQKIIKQ